jgi:general secretion pathway protein E
LIEGAAGMSVSETSQQAKTENRTEAEQRPINTQLASLLLESLGANEEGEAADEPSHAARALVRDAARERATDIHLDPEGQGLRVRMRIDGAMRDAALLIPKEGYRLINQLKSLAGIDPVAQFNADEARLAFEDGDRALDLRLAVIPCLHGQKITIRVLDPRQIVYRLHELGLSDGGLERIRHWFKSLGGMFVVAGPVGSGKTTTLYSLLHGLKTQHCSVSTLEDPVEYSVDGINQVEIDEEHGLTFPRGIKSLARHDPDVILVGELRDAPTTRAAYGAAALGRTILTTVHARDAAGTVTTLRYHGLDDRDIASTLSLVVAQRLVRKLCPHCRQKSTPNDEEKRWFDFIGVPVPETSWEPGGCDHCGQSGYFGQTGVFEVWRLEEEDYHLLLGGATERQIRDSLVSRAHRHFLADALEKAEAGVTTLAEVQALRLAGPALSPSAAAIRESTAGTAESG